MKRSGHQNAAVTLGLAALVAIGAGASQGCEGELNIGHDDAGGAGADTTAGAAGEVGAGAQGGGAAGTSGRGGGSGNAGALTGCVDAETNAVVCGAPCLVDGVNSQFVCSEEGRCVEGPIVCGAGLCADKGCGDPCGGSSAATCDTQGRCVSGAVDCGRSADLCSGKECGQLIVDGDHICLCDSDGRCLNGGPINCGAERCLGLQCGAPCELPDQLNLSTCVAEGVCATGPSYSLCELSDRCEGKACGADCSVEGFDVPLACSPTGHCVAASVSCVP